jgi:hypothetical protein
LVERSAIGRLVSFFATRVGRVVVVKQSVTAALLAIGFFSRI